jgi:hypothetical protein
MAVIMVNRAEWALRGREAEVAEWSKAVDLGSIPKGRGFKPHLLHFLITIIAQHHASISDRVSLKASSLAPLLK